MLDKEYKVEKLLQFQNLILFQLNLPKGRNEINMLKDKIKEFTNGEGNNKKKIENLVFLIVILIVTTIVINVILKSEKSSTKQEKTTSKVLAVTNESKEDDATNDMQKELEQILSTIKGVGKVKVYISYSESSKTIAM